jgi:hypothetical protein
LTAVPDTLRRTALCIAGLLFFLPPGNAVGQEKEFRSVNRILREEADSIAASIEEEVGAIPSDSVNCFVTDGQFKLPAENALAGQLMKKGIRVLIGPPVDSGMWRVSMLVLDCSVKYVDLERDLSQRRIRLSVEVRVQPKRSDEARFLRSFVSDKVDTVSRRDRESSDARAGSVPEHGEESTLQRLLTPLVLIAGTIVIVYLFFSVRS